MMTKERRTRASKTRMTKERRRASLSRMTNMTRGWSMQVCTLVAKTLGIGGATLRPLIGHQVAV